jgi:hypothetical protein
MKKRAHEVNREFSKEEVQMPVNIGKILNSPGYKRDANKKYTQISSHPG